MEAPSFWYKLNAKNNPFLNFLSRIYLWFFNRRIKKTPTYHSKKLKIICVGNVVAGGGGKTPTSIHVSKVLKKIKRNKKIAFLSRGYKGDLEGPIFVCLNTHRAKDVGDEPLILAQHASTIVSKNKAEGVKFAENKGIDYLVLDDGYQNPSVHKNIHILVIDDRGFGNAKLIPAGPLREPIKNALDKADLIVQTGKPEKPLEIDQSIFSAQYKPNITKNKNKTVFAFSGIANPEKFKRTLEELNYDIKGFESFPDHHHFTKKEIDDLKKKSRDSDANLITTEKDYVRLSDHQKEGVDVLPIILELEQNDEFSTLLKEKL